MLATSLELDHDEVYKVVTEYTHAFDLLDDYDHMSLSKPKEMDTMVTLIMNFLCIK